PGRLGATQHGRGGQAYARKTPEHILGGVGERQQRPRQAHQRHQARTDLVDQPQDVVIRKETLLAATAVVVGPLDLDGAMHRQHASLLVGVKLGRLLAGGAGQAAAYVPLFFRLARLACRMSLTNCCPASRNSKSMAPNSSASGTSTARSTIWRTAASTFGRSSFMIASMRSSRDSLAVAGKGCAAMVSSLVKNQCG